MIDQQSIGNNSSRLYNILWVEDEEKTQLPITARRFNMEIRQVKSMNGAIEEFRVNHRKYDGILMDFIFYKNEDDEPGTESDKWFNPTLEGIYKIDSSVPIVVYSGNEELIKVPQSMWGYSIEKFSKTASPSEMLEMLLKKIENRPIKRLELISPNLLEIFQPNYIGRDYLDLILKYARDLSYPDEITGLSEKWNGMRQILEKLFARLRQLNLIPQELGALSSGSRFLNGEHNIFRYKDSALVHPTIRLHLWHLIQIGHSGSHADSSDPGIRDIRVIDFVRSSKNNFMYLSAIWTLFLVLDYFKIFIDEHTDKYSNLEQWYSVEGENIEVEVCRTDHNFYVFAEDEFGYSYAIPKSQLDNNTPPKKTHLIIDAKWNESKQQLFTSNVRY